MSKPFIPWIGGKRRLAKQLLPMFPEHTCYVEPFAGAAALFFLKEPSKTEVINDLNGDLVNLYRVVQNHPEELYRQFKWALSSRQIFQWLKDAHTDPLTDIQRAARFFYLQKHSYGGVPRHNSFSIGTTGGPNFNLLRIEQDLSDAHLRLSRVYVENMDWQDVVTRYDRPHTLFFVDPPYYRSADYGTSVPLSLFSDIAACFQGTKGKAIITVSDIPEMRKAFEGMTMESLASKYTIGPSHGGTNNRELIVRNW